MGALAGLALLLAVPSLLAADPPQEHAVSEDWRPPDDDPHHARTAVSMGGALGLWSVLYWLMMDRNVADWDNPQPEERFNGRAWRLDNNSLPVNFVAHPLMGGAAYSIARANHHDPATSFAYAFATSFMWEFVLEFKEKVSVNDFIVTPGTAVPVGEFFHKLGLYLDSAHNPSSALHVAQWSLGTGVALDRSLDGRGDRPVPLRDNLGLSRAVWHRFIARSGLAIASTPGSDDIIRPEAQIRGTLVTLPGYLAPGNRAQTFYHAEVSELAVGAEASKYGAGFAMHADTIVAGHHQQRITQGPSAPRGHATTVGVSMAFRYLQSKANEHTEFLDAAEPPQPRWDHHVPKPYEQFSAFHMPGPAVDWFLFVGDVRCQFSTRIHPDFVGFGAPAFYDWASANPGEKSKHILHRQGYFFGWGGSARASLAMTLGPLSIGGDVFHGRYWSQDGLDRHVERLTADVPAAGRVLLYRGSIGLHLPTTPISLQADYSARRWYSRVGRFERRDRNVARGFSAVVAF